LIVLDWSQISADSVGASLRQLASQYSGNLGIEKHHITGCLFQSYLYLLSSG
jgi:hypothetical protein